MSKGYRGETCGEVIYEVVASSQPTQFSAIFEMTEARGTWGDHTIYRQLMKWIVNLPPAYREWPVSRRRFLFLRQDGLFELYSEGKHGVFREGTRIDVIS